MPLDQNVHFGLSLRFSVIIDGEFDLGAWSKAEGLDVSWDLAEYRAGDMANFKYYFPGATKFSNIKLTRGVSADGTKKVMDWLQKVSFEARYNTMAHIEMRDATNVGLAFWDIEGVVPVHYSGPRFDSTASQVATETLELAHQGFLEPMSGKPLTPVTK